MIRLFKLVYSGWNSSSYRYFEKPTDRYYTRPEKKLFFTHSAAEAYLNTIKISNTDILEMRDVDYYYPKWEVVELSKAEVFLEFISANYFEGFLYDEATGGYRYLENPWVSEAFWVNGTYGRQYTPEDFHPDFVRRTKDGNVIYVDVDTHRHVEMKPGKFLKKFFADVMTDRQIAYQAEFFKSGKRPPIPFDLKFAMTADEMLRVYAEGPQSCMKGSDSVTAYAGGDLALAYGEVDGKIMARVLCWPDKKVFGRLYPNDGNASRDGFDSERHLSDFKASMVSRLREMGYVSLEEKPDGFNGARLVREVVTIRHEVKMPYLDLGVKLKFDENGEMILDKDGPLVSGSTGGTMQFNEHTCAVCKTNKSYTQDGRGQYLLSFTPRGENATPKAVCPTCLATRFGNRRPWVDSYVTGYTYLLGEGQEPVKVLTNTASTAEQGQRYLKDGGYSREAHPDDPTIFRCHITGLAYHERWVNKMVTHGGIVTTEALARYDYDTGKIYLFSEKTPSEEKAEKRRAAAALKKSQKSPPMFQYDDDLRLAM